MQDLQTKLRAVGPFIAPLKDSHRICLILLKSTNDHALLFRAAKYGLEPSWLLATDSGFQEQPASMLDKSMMNLSVEEDGTLQFPFNLQKVCKLGFDTKSQPTVVSDVEGIACTIDVVYVDVVPKTMEKTNLYILGKCLKTGKQVHEVLSVDLSWVPVTFLQ